MPRTPSSSQQTFLTRDGDTDHPPAAVDQPSNVCTVYSSGKAALAWWLCFAVLNPLPFLLFIYTFFGRRLWSLSQRVGSKFSSGGLLLLWWRELMCAATRGCFWPQAWPALACTGLHM